MVILVRVWSTLLAVLVAIGSVLFGVFVSVRSVLFVIFVAIAGPLPEELIEEACASLSKLVAVNGQYAV